MAGKSLTEIQYWVLDHLSKSVMNSMNTYGISLYRARHVYGDEYKWGKVKLSIMLAMRALERKGFVNVAAPATQHDHHRVDLLDAGNAALSREKSNKARKAKKGGRG